jgi:hypothetical protein
MERLQKNSEALIAETQDYHFRLTNESEREAKASGDHEAAI